ncbi:hypothetical protein Pcinc_029047 [Petrolisthes cinctipes]|uniref:Uncharacterized protein n=1 Tax=Petrolisthes cinctipes TaxID=88211 RepID=A0AAE1K854_PETCI|nr:hypothetical protein Pcinc_029047 [Petrolisthes cinctipes]
MKGGRNVKGSSVGVDGEESSVDEVWMCAVLCHGGVVAVSGEESSVGEVLLLCAVVCEGGGVGVDGEESSVGEVLCSVVEVVLVLMSI